MKNKTKISNYSFLFERCELNYTGSTIKILLIQCHITVIARNFRGSEFWTLHMEGKKLAELIKNNLKISKTYNT